MQRRLEKENIRIERNYESDIPNLCLPGGLMEQVFLNLIINARDALLEKSETRSGLRSETRSEMGSEVREEMRSEMRSETASEVREEYFEKVLQIQVRKIQENQSQMVRITFRDTGAGIKPENLNRVFDPFFTTKREDKGTGLGLSISYGIIKDRQGNITVESREGEFTLFTIDLPINQTCLRSQEIRV